MSIPELFAVLASSVPTHKRIHVRVFRVVHIALLLSSLTLLPNGHAQAPIKGTVNELNLRSFASKVVAPIFPPRAFIKKEFGVAVAHVDLDISGRIKAITIVQSPSAEISDAMMKAIGDWQFDRVPPGDPAVEFSGKLTYYFLKRNGAPVVLSAAESFYAGPQVFAPPDAKGGFAPRRGN